jgi:hypothetical protein
LNDKRGRLTDTRQGRLVVIVVVGGTLLLALSFANLVGGHAVGRTTDEVRQALRRELIHVDDQTIARFPDSRDEIEAVAERAVDGRARVVGSLRPERPGAAARDLVVVDVEVRWAWELRCIRAELRGSARVLTDVDGRRC